jgi:quinol monooxygenase YgiN
VIVVRFKVQCQPEKTESVMAALKDVIAPSRALGGVISFDIARDLEDPNSFIATEVFEDRIALDRQERQSQVATVLSMLPDAVAIEPVATNYCPESVIRLQYVARVSRIWSALLVQT